MWLVHTSGLKAGGIKVYTLISDSKVAWPEGQGCGVRSPRSLTRPRRAIPRKLAREQALNRSAQSLRERYSLLGERGQLNRIFQEAGALHEADGSLRSNVRPRRGR